MAENLYQIDVIPSIPDQEFTTSLNGLVLNLRLFYATTTGLWWLEIASADRTVTLSQISVKPGVFHALQGKYPGYAGAAGVMIVRLRPQADFSSIDAFNGGFGLFLYDETEDE